MKSQNKIFLAFILNLIFSIVEFVGGIITGSIAIASDSLHDLGDAISVGASYFLEKKSKKKPNEKYTYGYLAFSVLGGAITNLILLLGSIIFVIKGIERLINPVAVDYKGMIIFAVFGIIVNFIATFLTRDKNSINEKAVNLHMLEDLLGWIVVLIGGILASIFNVLYLDSITSIILSIFIIYNALKGLKEIIDIYTIKTPKNVDLDKFALELNEIIEITEIHHLHVWTIDGNNNYATLHAVSDFEPNLIKEKIKNVFKSNGVSHVTVEIEKTNEICHEKHCEIHKNDAFRHCCHQHHGHHHH